MTRPLKTARNNLRAGRACWKINTVQPRDLNAELTKIKKDYDMLLKQYLELQNEMIFIKRENMALQMFFEDK